MAVKVTKMISKYNFTPDNISRIKYIVIHYVGAVGSAKANCQYFGAADRGASAHYFVDHNGDVYQCVEDQNQAWHCGCTPANGLTYKHPECRNKNSIGIELCCRTTGSTSSDTSWYFEDATVVSAIELTKELMKKYGIPADHVIRHYDVNGKICPAPYVRNKGKHTWDAFKAAISGEHIVVSPSSSGIQNQQTSQKETPLDANLKRRTPFTVKVSIDDLNIRKGPGTNYDILDGKCTGKGVFTIVEVQEGKGASEGWGLLKTYQTNRNGWVSLNFAKPN